MLNEKNLAVMKEIKRVTKFVLDTPDHGLKIEPEKMTKDKWVLKKYTLTVVTMLETKIPILVSVEMCYIQWAYLIC